MTPAARRHLAEGAAIGVATLHNWLSNRRLPASVYVPVNVAVATALVGLGRWGGASWADLGLDREHLRRGAVIGAAVSALAVSAISRAATRPQIAGWFADERVIALAPREAAFQAIIRIPVGTALAEELTFRGALMGLSLRRRSWLASAGLTSGLFGLWHVLPVTDTLSKNPLGQMAIDAGRPGSAITTAVVGSGVAGAGFALLRWMSGSVVSPVLVHAAVNVAAFATARRLHTVRTPR